MKSNYVVSEVHSTMGRQTLTGMVEFQCRQNGSWNDIGGSLFPLDWAVIGIEASGG